MSGLESSGDEGAFEREGDCDMSFLVSGARPLACKVSTAHGRIRWESNPFEDRGAGCVARLDRLRLDVSRARAASGTDSLKVAAAMGRCRNSRAIAAGASGMRIGSRRE